jgi:hypothetical protein
MKDIEGRSRHRDEAERALIVRFLADHELMPALVLAETEQIRDWFANMISRFTNEKEAPPLGLLAMWLVMHAPRQTLINLAIWLETETSSGDETSDDLEAE